MQVHFPYLKLWKYWIPTSVLKALCRLQNLITRNTKMINNRSLLSIIRWDTEMPPSKKIPYIRYRTVILTSNLKLKKGENTISETLLGKEILTTQTNSFLVC